MRPCGCDWDVRVFGHAHCIPATWLAGKHVICGCTTCTCPCHKDR